MFSRHNFSLFRFFFCSSGDLHCLTNSCRTRRGDTAARLWNVHARILVTKLIHGTRLVSGIGMLSHYSRHVGVLTPSSAFRLGV